MPCKKLDCSDALDFDWVLVVVVGGGVGGVGGTGAAGAAFGGADTGAG